ncbi:hypothetical protein HMPREF1624_04542 [Sporothrix schenckii ATCC 58251]|uniref:DUF1446 domain-containing protein n=1 Tax=Sporothrix schenckii (strain ATCC 58251 / de Perez 2211183) TaxID=1391915 RepID=U7PUN8_SPOS1|nr:hypothetical protein HMPREF1624_04542 [Sporothrix schenckii ATCC 58251]
MATSGTNGTHAGNVPRRPIRIAGCSAGVYDRKRALHDLAKNEDPDVITGDWMSECNMTWRGADKQERLAGGDTAKVSSTTGFEPSFVQKLDPAIPWLARRGIKVAVNAGASDVAGLADAVRGLCTKHGVALKVGYVDGDDVTEAFMKLYNKGEPFLSLPQNKAIQDWGFQPLAAQCYLGGSGVAACFAAGADIVVCGRVSDASLAVGAAMWWHGWTRETHVDELASALMVGHLIECGTYATGGYYSGFKAFGKKRTDFGYPIAAIDHKGEAVISMERGRHGTVNTGTITSQLLYEIQGPLYYNSDVTAQIDGITFTQVGDNQVHIGGVKGLPPPPTTKVGVTAHGGYQAEFHFYITGLDVAEKAAMMEEQIRELIGNDIDKFSALKFQLAGGVPSDPESQEAATVDFRVVAQSPHADLLSGDMVGADRGTFASYCIENLSQGYPGSTMAIDMRASVGRPYFEYWACLMSQEFVTETAHLPDGTAVVIPPPDPATTREYAREQPSGDTANPVTDLVAAFGPTTRAPLGYVVLGRSGDKSSNANVGFFVRNDDEWDWLRTLLNVGKLRELLGKDDIGKQIDRFELPKLRAVHFFLKDHLDRGFNSTTGFDSLGKNLCEYLRSKHVDIPNKFLERGRI